MLQFSPFRFPSSRSTTLSEFFLKKPILPITLCRIACEWIGAKVPPEYRGNRLEFFSFDKWIHGPKASIRFAFPKWKQQHSSIIWWQKDGRDFYLIIVSRKSTIAGMWFRLAVELGHLILHDNANLLRKPPRERNKASNLGRNLVASAEARFFSQLCFWPLATLFSPTAHGRPRSDTKIVNTLFHEYRRYFAQQGIVFRDDSRLMNSCWVCLNFLRLRWPDKYREIVGAFHEPKSPSQGKKPGKPGVPPDGYKAKNAK